MKRVTFVAKQTTTGYYLRKDVVSELSKFVSEKSQTAHMHQLVEFPSIFAAYDFFQSSRHDTSNVEIERHETVLTDSWSFEAVAENHAKMFGN